MSEEVAASIGDVLAENARLRKEVAQATERARIASDAYHQQQDAQREHESREQAATERALAAEAERDQARQDVGNIWSVATAFMKMPVQDAVAWRLVARRLERRNEQTSRVNRELNVQVIGWIARASVLERAARRLLAAWRAERQRRHTLADALQGLLDDPYGCPMCDCGRLRNPTKKHWPECPYEIARAVLAELREA